MNFITNIFAKIKNQLINIFKIIIINNFNYFNLSIQFYFKILSYIFYKKKQFL